MPAPKHIPAKKTLATDGDTASCQETAISAKQDVQVSVGEGQSTVTFGAFRVEVSTDGRKVTAYTNDGVETKAVTNGEAEAEGTLISVSNDFNTVVLNGVTIERAADGHLVISAPGTVITKPVNSKRASNDSKKELEPGDRMPDGTIFAGISPDTGENMFVTPPDACFVVKWEAAMKYAANLNANGHKDWKLPTKAELDVLYQNRDKGALNGTFNKSGSSLSVAYWSSTEHTRVGDAGAWNQSFPDGDVDWHWKDYAKLSVCCVRSIAL